MEQTQRVGHLLDSGVGLVAELTLLVAQRPERRHLHVACEVGKGLHQLPGTVALDDDHTEGWALALEHHIAVGADGLSPGVVGDDAKGRTIGSDAHHPGMTLIEMGAAIHAIGGRIDVPQTDGAPIATQGTSHLARAIEVDVVAYRDFGYGQAVANRKLGAQLPTGRQGVDGRRLLDEDGRRAVL